MNLKYTCFWICLITILSPLFGCTQTENSDGDVIKQKEVTLLITEKNNTQQNYAITILTNGMEMGNVATIPMVKTLITTTNKAELEIFIGQAYTLKVHSTPFKSIDELNKNKLQKPSTDTHSSEEKPLVTYEFIGEEEVDIIELEIPSE